jgi:hypothetical protein
MKCCPPNRRTFLKALGAAAGLTAVGSPVFRAIAAPETSDEFFIFIHISGGWDVLLWSDPRNEAKGLVDPPSTDQLKTDALKHWVNKPLDPGTSTFELVQPPGSNLVFGPAIGDLYERYDRLCVINGIAMNTVSHPDGIVFSSTGQHLVGSRAVAPSVDTIIANELGLGQLFPVVSARFPSWFVGSNLDKRATPVIVDAVGAVGKSLARTGKYDQELDRDQVTKLLIEEAQDLAARSYYPDAYDSMGLQLEDLRKILSSNIRDVFTSDKLKAAQPTFDYAGQFHGRESLNGAFAVEAMKRNVIRCASFGLDGFDTHTGNYQYHGLMLQEAFDFIAKLMDSLEVAPHPTLTGKKLADHTHILVISEFCRGPAINPANGRDHYPNNSALIISPKFKGNYLLGKSDHDQLLPVPIKGFSDGERAVSPADILCSFIGAFGIDPREYLRDGEIMKELYAS